MLTIWVGGIFFLTFPLYYARNRTDVLNQQALSPLKHMHACSVAPTVYLDSPTLTHQQAPGGQRQAVYTHLGLFRDFPGTRLTVLTQ